MLNLKICCIICNSVEWSPCVSARTGTARTNSPTAALFYQNTSTILDCKASPVELPDNADLQPERFGSALADFVGLEEDSGVPSVVKERILPHRQMSVVDFSIGFRQHVIKNSTADVI